MWQLGCNHKERAPCNSMNASLNDRVERFAQNACAGEERTGDRSSQRTHSDVSAAYGCDSGSESCSDDYPNKNRAEEMPHGISIVERIVSAVGGAVTRMPFLRRA